MRTPENNGMVEPGTAVLGHPLSVIRKRRMLLFITVLLYIPLLMVVHTLWPTHLAMGIYFVIWFVVLICCTAYSALLRCPGCGNFFHMHGMTLLYLRKCLHCQLHINADKVSNS